MTEKDYDNDKNLYNDTFFDIYCHCKKPYDTENNKSFMLACYSCEDWFHSNCLLPPILQKSIDEEYILICRACLPKMRLNQILPYTDFMEKSCKKAFETYYSEGLEANPDVCSTKRQKLSETDSKPTMRSCKQGKQIEFGNDSPALDVVISDKFFEVLC